SNDDGLARLEVGLSNGATFNTPANLFDYLVCYRQGITCEAHDFDDTAGGADWQPVVVESVESDEEVAGKQGRFRYLLTCVSHALALIEWSVAFEALALQMFLGSVVLAWFALDQVPAR